MRKIAGLIVLLFVFSGCKNHVTIEQQITLTSYINCTYHVESSLWVRNIFGDCVSLEELIWDSNVSADSVCSVKERQYKKLFPKYIKIKNIIDSNRKPCPKIK
jgi:hypothetical protein